MKRGGRFVKVELVKFAKRFFEADASYVRRVRQVRNERERVKHVRSQIKQVFTRNNPRESVSACRAPIS